MRLPRKQRLLNQIRGEPVDRVPMLGGWNLGVRNLATIAGISIDEYLRDPFRGVILANHALDVDGIVPPIVPTDIDAIRAGLLEERNFAGVEPEVLKARADTIPDSERAVLARFDPTATEKNYRDFFEPLLARLDGLELITTIWEAAANFALYFQYGYEAFLSATALYPEEIGRIYWEDSLLARARNQIIVRLMMEYQLVPLLFTGHDICNNDGPMCSPEFLRRHYWAHARRSLEPFVEAGIRVIGHCDGDVMPLIDDMMGAGFSGFQGFQYECGVDPCAIRRRRTSRGETPLLFTGLSITRTLPYGTARDVQDEVDYFLDLTDGGQGMFLFTSNVTGVEVPPESIVAAYRHLAARCLSRARAGQGTQRRWPWAMKNAASI